MYELVDKFATSQERAAILRGLKSYRDDLRNIGFSDGFQWIDGSFVEDCEAVHGRPPGDVDVVSVVHRPAFITDLIHWHNFVTSHRQSLFNRAHCKTAYSCDTYYIDLNAPPTRIVAQAAYWFGLFSHQRGTFRWKGLVQVDFQSDDDAAMQLLSLREARW